MADDRSSPREAGGQPASPVATSLDEGREFFDQREWGRAHTILSAVERESGLDLEDLQRLAVVAFLVGEEGRSIQLWSQAHNECLRQANRSRAARCAFWLGFVLVNTGEMARASGWFARAERMIEGQPDCVERGYLMVMEAHQGLVSGDAEAAIDTFERSVELGERFDDPDLIMLARLGRGQAMIELGQIETGVAVLDEVMVAVTTDEVSPLVTGLVYCAVIVSYREAFDVRRAQEWTAALSQWCDAQPDLVPYRGQCLVHRAEVMRLHGAWGDAMTEAQRACARLDGEPAVGDAYYERAELHRLVGELTLAEEAYRDANRWGRSPQPGLALLRLDQSRLDAADSAIRNALAESPGRLRRPRLLAASVEIALAAGDVTAARAGADELAGIAGEVGAPLLHALAAQAQGAVLLAEGDAAPAQAALRRAWRAWQDLEAPYEAAQVRVLMALACRALGDHETADLELDAARWTFEHLGAKPDVARLEDLAAAGGATTAEHSLTRRELEVLALVATGKTNREVAAALVISEKTVARHVSNIFVKLGVSSRAAATAYSYEHGLMG